MTNYERIKAMSVEEMAKAMGFNIDCICCPIPCNEPCEAMPTCSESFRLWLESEVDT